MKPKLAVAVITYLFISLLAPVATFAAEEPNGIYSMCYATSDAVPTGGGACPNWFLALDRTSTDEHTTERLIVELNSCMVWGEYTVHTVKQNSSMPMPVELKVGDFFIVWDENLGDEDLTVFNFTGHANIVEEEDFEALGFARITSTNDNIIRRVIRVVDQPGEITVPQETCCNEHDFFCINSNLIDLTKTDDVEDCTEPDESVTYTICFDSGLTQTIVDPVVIDWLPDDVFYPGSVGSMEIGDISDPNTWLYIPPDPGYSEDDHSYSWFLDDIDPNSSGCLNLTVTVRDTAPPGGYLHNVVELYGTIMVVADPNDPNTLTPEFRLIARAELDTEVCCWQELPSILYVDKNSPAGSSGNGFSWGTAFDSLQDALNYARSQTCGEIEACYVAQGTYSPGTGENDNFDLSSLPGISLYGGFPTGGCDFSLRNPKRYETILSGKIDDTHRNTTVLRMGNNTYVEGFTINESSLDGQGLYGCCGSFSVISCNLLNNLGYGAFIEDADATFKWCNFRNNKGDGIRHTGENKSVWLENVWIRQSGRHAVYSTDSVPTIINSVLSESDLALAGRAGLMMENASQRPYLQNVTCSHNRTLGIWRAGGALPEIYNSIVFHNGGEALVGFSADEAAMYSCIEDANSINGNIAVDPTFLYFDPNNVRLSPESDCRNASAPSSYIDYSAQHDMDGNPRVTSIGLPPDMGAYEVVCNTNVSSEWDWVGADGLVNFREFAVLSRFFGAHDPNDPGLHDPNHPDYEYLTDPNSPGYVTQSSIALWYPDGYTFNYVNTGTSQYAVDLADVLYWADEAPWAWRACWVNLEEMQIQQIPGGGEEILLMGGDFMELESSQVVSEPTLQPELSVQEQIVQLQESLVFLAQIWLEEPDLQQEINAEDWQAFMDAIYQNLVGLQTGSVQLE